MQHMRCSTCNAARAMPHVRGSTCDAARAMPHLQCSTTVCSRPGIARFMHRVRAGHLWGRGVAPNPTIFSGGPHLDVPFKAKTFQNS